MAMTRILVTMLTTGAATAACATMSAGDGEPPVAGAGPCEADQAARLIGERASQPLAVDAINLTFAREFRWIPPNSAVTMDYRPGRLNIEYDEDGIVTDIRCG